MAEAVVGLLMGKLGEALVNEAATYGACLLCKEASALMGLFGEMRKIEAELEIMQAYLHDSDKFKDTNETTDLFVKKIRALAFRIEDVVDEFTYKLQDNHGGLVAKTKKRVKHVKTWRRLALKLHDINSELEDTIKRRDRYAMTGIEGYAGISGHHATSIHQTVWFAREEDLVGIEDNADKLTRWLIGDLHERRNKIATVWGMGGVGKTTLVDLVYKTVKVDFNSAAWITVSSSYTVEDLLKKIAREFGILDNAGYMEIRSLVEIIRNFLEGKRYILVLDDVWQKDVWIQIMDVFPTYCTSRIVLTTRKYEVASLADSNCSIKLEPLEENHSWKLFCNVAFRNDDDKKCPLELQDLAAKFLQKCEGLPLAIACVGRLLSCKSPVYSAWKILYDELALQLTKNVVPGVDIIFKVSFEDLPYELKNCFLHCAIFPEDYEMHRRRLIKHWIAAGFIKEKEQKTLEQVAEGYLNELVNRSLLQVAEKNETGRVRCFRMHDIIRRLALDKAGKECFGKVYEGSEAFSADGARRLTINSGNITPLSQSGATHLRAIHAFTSYLDIDLLMPIIASSNLLSTLDVQGTQIKYLPNEIFSLFNLRLLGLRFTGIEVLPEAVGRLQNLEVLDAHGTCLRYLPKDVAKLKKLRFLYASGLHADETFVQYDGIKVPSGIKDLTGLHALQTVKASIETLHDVAALTELRTLSVCDVTSEYSLILCNVVMNMRHLVHLSIRASSRNEVLPWEALTLPETLCKLRVRGKLEKKQMPQILSSWSHLNNLTRLSLIFSKLDEDSFSSLVMLRGLCLIRLTKAYDGKKLCFSALSFPRLRRLEIRGAPQLNQVEIEESALESLVELEFLDCPELKCLPHGIEYLSALEELRLDDTAEELIEKLRQQCEANECSGELMRISHIKKVLVKLTKQNIWERIR